ncbi:MAG: pectate lyase [Pirellulaceae bacterium]
MQTIAKIAIAALCWLSNFPAGLAAEPTRAEALAALKKAATFFHEQVGTDGGYLYKYSGDLQLREAEGIHHASIVWVQPPGTPTIGEAFLDAFDATDDPYYLAAAKSVAGALLQGQLRSGGWDHEIELDHQKRLGYAYRDVPSKRKQAGKSSLDDDISQSAMRFLIRLDETLQHNDAKLHEATLYALDAFLKAQRPGGGWYQWWDKFPTPAGEAEFPIRKASYPQEWSRKWLNDWTGQYYLNDNVMANNIATLLAAHRAYGDARYLAAAERAGDFLILAQMPDPQPAWAQQYDLEMHPVWDRKFEPPAISGRESQDVILVLLTLHETTGNEKYLRPIPPALAYLKKSTLPDGRLARFYELQTNRPLYFKRTGKIYDLTYSDAELPDHYGFVVESRLADIERKYRAAIDDRTNVLAAPKVTTFARGPSPVRRAIDALDARGAWVERGRLPHHKVEPASGVIDCATFAANIKLLCEYLAANP